MMLILKCPTLDKESQMCKQITFEEALQLLKQGKKIKHIDWETSYYLEMINGGVFQTSIRSDIITPFTFGSSDFSVKCWTEWKHPNEVQFINIPVGAFFKFDKHRYQKIINEDGIMCGVNQMSYMVKRFCAHCEVIKEK